MKEPTAEVGGTKLNTSESCHYARTAIVLSQTGSAQFAPQKPGRRESMVSSPIRLQGNMGILLLPLLLTLNF